MKTGKSRWLQALMLGAVICIAAACGEDTTGNENGNGDNVLGPLPEPTGQYANQAQAVIDVLDDYFRENEAMMSLSAVSSAISGVGFDLTPLWAVMAPNGTGIPGYAESVADGLEPSIPNELKGNVYVLQDSPFGYVVDSGRTGPDNGVRFILYDVNLTTGLPSSPLTETGHVDITEGESDPNDVEFDVVINGESLFDLSIEAPEAIR